jgi:hypothetical protein
MNTHQKEQQYRKAQRRVRRLNRYRLNNLKSLFKPREKVNIPSIRAGWVGEAVGVAWYEPKPKWSKV